LLPVNEKDKNERKSKKQRLYQPFYRDGFILVENKKSRSIVKWAALYYVSPVAVLITTETKSLISSLSYQKRKNRK